VTDLASVEFDLAAFERGFLRPQAHGVALAHRWPPPTLCPCRAQTVVVMTTPVVTLRPPASATACWPR
jgi:hypothetical protein